MKNNKAFTLVELLTVIVVLGIIIAIGVPSLTKLTNKTSSKANVISISNIIDSIKIANIKIEDDCFYNYSLDKYELPKGIKKLYIYFYKNENEKKYAVYAVDNNNKVIVDTMDFNKIDKEKEETYIDENGKMSEYINETNEEIVFSQENTICNLIKGE